MRICPGCPLLYSAGGGRSRISGHIRRVWPIILPMKRTLQKRKIIAALGITVAALLAGAFVRASLYEPSLFTEPPLGEIVSAAGALAPAGDHPSPGEGEPLRPLSEDISPGREGEKGPLRPQAAGGSSGKNSSLQEEPADLKKIQKAIRPITRSPGDMKDYLDEAERARRRRIRTSLQEVQSKVREWRGNIFEPTW